MKVDFHTHTLSSPDSPISPESLASRARELGIVPAITDHYSMASIKRIKKTGIQFIAGEELRVSVGKRGADLIGLFMNECIKKGTEVEEAMDLIRAQGALIYAPHPFDSFRMGLREEALLKKADIIEVFNAHSPDKSNAMALEFAQKENKAQAAGSDCHFLFEFGQTYTEIELDELEPKKLLAALKKGKITAKKSPRLRRLAHRALSSVLKPFI
ncbi:PHP domain-containing protein [Candidatus Micrarchaeota archaeon]|nr:PHP domain-containing protein [Candidatus Micrarchaeota archaeon]